MSSKTHPPGTLSLAYHIVYDTAVRDAFRDNWVEVATEFALTAEEKDAVNAATQSGVYSQSDAQALCKFMQEEIDQNLAVALPPNGPVPSPAPPLGMLAACYHVFIAKDGIPLAAFDLSAADQAAIQQKNLANIGSGLLSDFEQRYQEVYTLAW
jgi:hypothetical protein